MKDNEMHQECVLRCYVALISASLAAGEYGLSDLAYQDMATRAIEMADALENVVLSGRRPK